MKWSVLVAVALLCYVSNFETSCRASNVDASKVRGNLFASSKRLNGKSKNNGYFIAILFLLAKVLLNWRPGSLLSRLLRIAVWEKSQCCKLFEVEATKR